RGSARRPAPVSTPRSPGPTAAMVSIRRTVLASATKFRPRARLGASPCASNSSRTWRRLRVTAPRLGPGLAPWSRSARRHLHGLVAQRDQDLLEDVVGRPLLDLRLVGLPIREEMVLTRVLVQDA